MADFGWGILGAGNIARKFARDLAYAPGARLAAIGSRDAARAAEFAGEQGAQRAHGSHEALANDPGVEAVYVATRHPDHAAAALLCLEAGKPVLVEKPFTLNAAEARRVAAAAGERRLFCMEAMWMRFFPVMEAVRAAVARGAIGEPRMVLAHFGYRGPWEPGRRHLNLEDGGGALLDVGIYPVSLASMILGPVRGVCGLAHLGETGVDEQSAIVLRHDDGRLASLTCAVRTDTPHEADILGTGGRIRIHASWWRPTGFTLVRPDHPDEHTEIPHEGAGYQFQAIETMRCVRAGLTESPVMPLDESIRLMEVLDECRSLWGLRYPGESPATTPPRI